MNEFNIGDYVRIEITPYPSMRDYEITYNGYQGYIVKTIEKYNQIFYVIDDLEYGWSGHILKLVNNSIEIKEDEVMELF